VLNRGLWGSSHSAPTKTHPPLSPHLLTLLSTSSSTPSSFFSIQPSATPPASGASALNSFRNLVTMKRSLHRGSPPFHFSFRFLGCCSFHSVNRSPSHSRRLSPCSSKPQPQVPSEVEFPEEPWTPFWHVDPLSVLSGRSANSPTSPASGAAAPSLPTPSSLRA
jgi:hypothetical protein